MGYCKISAAEQIFYILKYKAHELRLAFSALEKAENGLLPLLPMVQTFQLVPLGSGGRQ